MSRNIFCYVTFSKKLSLIFEEIMKLQKGVLCKKKWCLCRGAYVGVADFRYFQALNAHLTLTPNVLYITSINPN